jgi:hypothetical protein
MNWVVQSDIFSFFLIVWEKLEASIEKDIAYGFSTYSHWYLRYISCTPQLKDFPWRNVACYWMLSLYLLRWPYSFVSHPSMWHITFIDFYMLRQSCMTEMTPSWSHCMIFAVCCWIQFAGNLPRIFASVCIRSMGQ